MPTNNDIPIWHHEEQHHSHYFSLTITDMVAYRHCCFCGRAWKLVRVMRQWNTAYAWQAIEEPHSEEEEGQQP